MASTWAAVHCESMRLANARLVHRARTGAGRGAFVRACRGLKARGTLLERACRGLEHHLGKAALARVTACPLSSLPSAGEEADEAVCPVVRSGLRHVCRRLRRPTGWLIRKH